MNIEMQKYLSSPYTKEAMVAEAAIQCIMNGAYLDVSDIKKGFAYEHWSKQVAAYAQRYGMR